MKIKILGGNPHWFSNKGFGISLGLTGAHAAGVVSLYEYCFMVFTYFEILKYFLKQYIKIILFIF
jgi:hypothetical protein